MSTELIDIAERAYLKKEVPQFHIGDTVDVTCRIIEGNRQRLQVFNGVVIARRGRGINEMFTVRRIVNNEGVERVFMLHSPLIANVEVKRRGKVRRAKLYYLRGRVGKARRLRELRLSSAKKARLAARAAGNAVSETDDLEEASQETSPEPVNA
jgi:large subunit ribosomal protein L19